MILILKILLILFIITVTHELGHILFLKLFKIRVVYIQIFYLNLIEINFNSFAIAFGLIPGGGYVMHRMDTYDRLSIYKKLLILLGGVLANLFVAGICYFIDGAFSEMLMIFSLIKAALNILPVPGTDGHQIIMLNNHIR